MNTLFLKPNNSLRHSLRHLIAIAFAILLVPSSTFAAPPTAGEVFPDLVKFNLEGALPDLKDKVVLVDFWASWCGPCKKSFPVMRELHEKFGARGFVVVAVSLDRKQPAMDAFVKKEAPPFTILRDAKGSLAEALKIDTMPTSFLVAADGKLITTHRGFEGESTRKKYLAEVETALQAAHK
ncbi:MAG: TlpA family protein disulfide reductase [Verrucomicrobia bacterium]|nr:TlpA family protein disulfide reductase [Verrucomicrobiota bacterium]